MTTQPEIWSEDYWTIETNCGTETVPASVCDWKITEAQKADYCEVDFQRIILTKFGDYLDGQTVYSAERSSGYLARLSAPGYMDCTETSSFDSEAEAIEFLLDMYGTQDDGPCEDWESDLEERLTALKASQTAFNVIVGNVGLVHSSNDKRSARLIYNRYVDLSQSGRGRAGNESVVLFCGDEIIAEHKAANSEAE